MANWTPLRKLLTDVPVEVTVTWSDLDELVGGLPPSSYKHAAFWKGRRSGRPGFAATIVTVGSA